MRAVSPKIETVEQPVQFLNRQDDHFVCRVGRCFKTLGFEALEPKAKAIALPVQNFDSGSGLIKENKQHRVEHRDLDIQFDQSSKTIDGLSEVDRLGVEVNFFNFGVGTHHEVLAPERDREHSIGYQMSA